MTQLRKKSLQGMVWTFAQQFSVQLLSFLVSIVLARLLMPNEFGLVGMIAVVISIGVALKDAGMSHSLIRTQKPDELDYATVFYLNLFVSFIVYALIFISSPWIGDFYNKPVLIQMIRLLALGIIIDAFSTIQRTKLTKEMNFKTQFLVDLPSLIVSGIVGVVMAYCNYGVWSIVAMQLVKNSLASIQLWIHSKWIPKFIFSVKRLKVHLNFGYKLTLSGLLDVLYNNIYNVLIGKFFSAADLGYYTRSSGTTNLVVQNVSGAINKVTYPLFSEIQDNDIRLKNVYVLIMQQVLFWVAPILIGAAVLAEPLFRFVYTEKWLPAVPMFQILCVVGIMYPIHVYNLSILNVKGRSDLFLKLELVKKIIAITCIFIVLPYGIYALLYFQVIFSIFALVINTYYSGELINYKIFEQIKDIAPILFVAAIMGGICFLLDQLLLSKNCNDLSRIIVGAFVGFLSYLAIAKLIQSAPLNEFIKIIRKKA